MKNATKTPLTKNAFTTAKQSVYSYHSQMSQGKTIDKSVVKKLEQDPYQIITIPKVKKLENTDISDEGYNR